MSAEFDVLVEKYGGWRKATWHIAAKRCHELKLEHIIETGCYRGTPADGASTMILAQLSKDIGGWVDSYELNPKNIAIAKEHLRSFRLERQVAFHEGDSVVALAKRAFPVSFAYLDSYDCGPGPDYSACQQHQLAELEAVLPLMERRSLIMLDDHVKEGGKTDLSMKRLDGLAWNKIADDYQVIYETENAHRLVPCRFCVLCGHGEQYAPMAARTLYQNRAQYCLKHGYDLRLFRKTFPEFQNGDSHAGGYTWSRLKRMLQVAESGAYEWIWCVGCDTLVTNFCVRLEDLVADSQTEESRIRPFPYFPPTTPMCPGPVIHWRKPKDYPISGEKHVIFCGEAVAPLQADSFMVRCTPEGINYLRDILGTYMEYRTHVWVENQAMIDLIHKHAPIIHILPQHRLNAYDYSLFYDCGDLYRRGMDCYGNRGQWQHGDFMIHWPAQTYEQRMNLLDRYEHEVIK